MRSSGKKVLKPIVRKPGYVPDTVDISAHLSLAVNLVASGRDEEARAEVEEIYRHPKFSLDYIAKTWPIKKQAEKELFINTLRKAGMK